MERYLFTDNTVAILKQRKRTIIYNVENKLVINKTINRVLEYNCNFYGSSVKGRRKSGKMYLKVSYKVPLIINNRIILLQLTSLRNDECLFLVLNKIINFKYIDHILEINCINNVFRERNVSAASFEKMIVRGIKLSNLINNQKYTNFL